MKAGQCDMKQALNKESGEQRSGLTLPLIFQVPHAGPIQHINWASTKCWAWSHSPSRSTPAPQGSGYPLFIDKVKQLFKSDNWCLTLELSESWSLLYEDASWACFPRKPSSNEGSQVGGSQSRLIPRYTSFDLYSILFYWIKCISKHLFKSNLS